MKNYNVQFKLKTGKEYNVPFTLITNFGFSARLNRHWVRSQMLFNSRSMQQLADSEDGEALKQQLVELRGYEKNYLELGGNPVCRQSAIVIARRIGRDGNWNYSNDDSSIVLHIYTDLHEFTFTLPEGLTLVDHEFFNKRWVYKRVPHPFVPGMTVRQQVELHLFDGEIVQNGNQVTVKLNYKDDYNDAQVPKNTFGLYNPVNLYFDIPIVKGVYEIPEISGAIFNIL
jgi:hypothetical protein